MNVVVMLAIGVVICWVLYELLAKIERKFGRRMNVSRSVEIDNGQDSPSGSAGPALQPPTRLERVKHDNTKFDLNQAYIEISNLEERGKDALTENEHRKRFENLREVLDDDN